MTNKAIKYRLYPTDDQCVMFAKTFGCCRKVYNLMLEDKIESSRSITLCWKTRLKAINLQESLWL